MSGQFFAPLQHLANDDPLAKTLNLPGSHTYANQQNQDIENMSMGQGGYAGVAPTLAGANAGYAAGGPGSTFGQTNAPVENAFMANAAGTANPYVTAAGKAVSSPWATAPTTPPMAGAPASPSTRPQTGVY
jgi:hypothetical protein